MNSVRSKFYIYFVVSLILSVILSCQEREDDKYPDIPFFPNTSSSNWQIVKFNSKIGLKIKNRIYHKYINSGWAEDSLVIQDLEYNKLKKIIIEGYIAHIEESGLVFSVKDSNAYQYLPPKFKKEKLRVKTIKKLYDSIREKNLNLENKLIHQLEDSIIKSTVAKGLICKIKLGDYRYNILKYENENILVKDLNPNFEHIECKEANQSSFNGKEITPFDQVHLGYSWNGSNHIAFGVNSKKLYYYKYIVNKDTFLFKDSYQYIETFTTPKGKILFKDGKYEFYELIKKQ